jgi:hypothetical protein
MNERELSLIKAIGESVRDQLLLVEKRFDAALQAHIKSILEMKADLERSISESRPEPLPDINALVSKAVETLPAPKMPQLPDIDSIVAEAIAKLPAPQDGKSVLPEDVRPMLQDMVSAAVAEIPAPENGKDFDPDALKQAVAEAVAKLPLPQDGKSVLPEDVRPMLQDMVSAAVTEIPDVKELVNEAVNEAVNAIPAPESGSPGRDALQIEILPSIDESKSYPRGSYATHNGGLWRAFEKTHELRGWECLVDGVAAIDVARGDQRNFTVTVMRSSGASEIKAFDIPVLIYRGVFKADKTYQAGDTVTWGGSLWHCDEPTADKPGEIGSKGWTLAAKRGRDARNKI